MPFVCLVGPFVYWMMFYYQGINISTNHPKFCVNHLCTVAIVAFVGQLIESYYTGPGIKATTWIWSYFGVYILYSNKIIEIYSRFRKYFRPLVIMGQYSFGIYLVHVYILIIVEKIASDCLWPIRLIIVITLTLLCVWAADKILPYKIVKYLGLK